jgi:hypothetical protein
MYRTQLTDNPGLEDLFRIDKAAASILQVSRCLVAFSRSPYLIERSSDRRVEPGLPLPLSSFEESSSGVLDLSGCMEIGCKIRP